MRAEDYILDATYNESKKSNGIVLRRTVHWQPETDLRLNPPTHLP